MDEIKVFSKILNVREKERKDAEIAHQESIQTFEESATKLYRTLKKKEAMEAFYTKSLQAVTIDSLRGQQDYIERLKQKIIQQQEIVGKARTKMETNQNVLSKTHIEVKKFETIIDVRRKIQDELQKQLEQTTMDEISMQQYLSRRLGV